MITIESMEQNDALVSVLEEERHRHRVCVAQSADETLTVSSYASDGKAAKRQVFVRADGQVAEARNI